ncbi:MAG: hypothetical protein AAF657_08620 [Acidobacteriota bacterium]
MHDDRQAAQSIRERLVRHYDRVFLILSPPRCCSTAIARVFWNQPSVAFYCHEPFEAFFYAGRGLGYVGARLEQPLSVGEPFEEGDAGRDLVIKEMSFQAGKAFPLLAEWTQQPILFVIRDPRLSISSRMAKKAEGGNDPLFPFIESGWESLAEQIRYCEKRAIPHLIVDAADVRNRPREIFPKVFSTLGLPFDEEMLSWQACRDLDLDGLDGRHTHWYRRVLASTTIEPANEPLPEIGSFPAERGFREHVRACLETYKPLYASMARIASEASRQPTGSATAGMGS